VCSISLLRKLPCRLVFCVSMAAACLAIGAVTASQAEAWKEDLHFLAKEMERVHPNLFHAVSREQFNAAVAELDGRIPSLTRDDIILGMAKLVALIGEGHTQMGLASNGDPGSPPPRNHSTSRSAPMATCGSRNPARTGSGELPRSEPSPSSAPASPPARTLSASRPARMATCGSRKKTATRSGGLLRSEPSPSSAPASAPAHSLSASGPAPMATSGSRKKSATGSRGLLLSEPSLSSAPGSAPTRTLSASRPAPMATCGSRNLTAPGSGGLRPRPSSTP
jgi:hypothetical protein